MTQTRGTVKRTVLRKTGSGLVMTTDELLEWYEPSEDKVLFGYNKQLLPKNFFFVGTLEGREVNTLQNAAIRVTASKIGSFTATSIRG